MQIGGVNQLSYPVRSPFSVPSSEPTATFIKDEVLTGPAPAPIDVPESRGGFRQAGRMAMLAVALTLSLGTVVTGCAASAAPLPDGAVQQSTVVQGSQDIGSRSDVMAVKQAIQEQSWQPGNVSISHDWAMGRGFTKDDAVSVLLHRVDGRWKVADSDGGAYVASSLQAQGVPNADIPNLLRVYR